MGRKVVKETLGLIFELASTRMLKTLVEIGYMAEIYKEVEYGKIIDAQDKICEQLLSEIFEVE